MNCLLHIAQQGLGPILHFVANRLDERGPFYLSLWAAAFLIAKQHINLLEIHLWQKI
jgi:hypothetical protein